MKKSIAICIFLLLSILVSLLLASKYCDHVFENWEVEINATCTEDGIKHSKCTNCDKTISEVIPATGHLESKMEIIKSATCEIDGLTQSHCENCGEILSTKSTPAPGHVESDVKIVSTVTCTTDGINQISCQVCGEILHEEIIPATGHTPSEKETVRNATCEKDGLNQISCKTCGEILEKEVIPAFGHTESEWETVTAPSCTKEGKQKISCTTCKKVLKTENIPKTSHIKGEWQVIVNPACAEVGLKRIFCKTCGGVLEEQSIPKLNHTFVSHVCTVCGAADSVAETLPFVNNPAGYQLQTKNTTVLYGGSYNLKVGVMGYRVRCVQRYLGEKRYKYGIFDYTTDALVRTFQKNNDLTVTGEVDLETWTAMGFTEEEWKEWDTYVHPSEITSDMTRSEIIKKFVDIAYTYLGAEYIYGCAGSPSQGGDCSGFVLSCLYGIGINPEGYDSQQHNFNEYNSRLMWTDEHFKKVNLKDRQIGDLVFYCNSNGIIIHVAIYIGNDLCIESCRNTIEVLSLYKYSMQIAGIKRVLYY